MGRKMQPTLIFGDEDLNHIQKGTLIKVFERSTPRTAHLHEMCLENKTNEGFLSFIRQGEEEHVLSYQIVRSRLKYNGPREGELNGSVVMHYMHYVIETYLPDSPEQKRGKEILINAQRWEESMGVTENDSE